MTSKYHAIALASVWNSSFLCMSVYNVEYLLFILLLLCFVKSLRPPRLLLVIWDSIWRWRWRRRSSAELLPGNTAGLHRQALSLILFSITEGFSSRIWAACTEPVLTWLHLSNYSSSRASIDAARRCLETHTIVMNAARWDRTRRQERVLLNGPGTLFLSNMVLNNSRHNLKSDWLMKTYVLLAKVTLSSFYSKTKLQDATERSIALGSLSYFAFNFLFQTSGIFFFIIIIMNN